MCAAPRPTRTALPCAATLLITCCSTSKSRVSVTDGSVGGMKGVSGAPRAKSVPMRSQMLAVRFLHRLEVRGLAIQLARSGCEDLAVRVTWNPSCCATARPTQAPPLPN